MVPWAFGVPLVLVSALGLFLNGYVLLVVLGLGKQVNEKKKNDKYFIDLYVLQVARECEIDNLSYYLFVRRINNKIVL